MAGAQISTSVSIIDNLKGYMALSLTEYNTSAAAAIAAGSVVEIAGAFFTFAADETPTGWTAITTGNTAYIALTASGTAGSQVVNANYTSTAPTWRDDLQGWYASAASSVRIVASVYKAESTSYYPKYVLAKDQELSFSSGVQIRGVLSVSSSLTISGSPGIPYRATTESFVRGSLASYTFTSLTTISTVYSINAAYVVLSGAPTSALVVASTLSNGTIYVAHNHSTTTNVTFVVGYSY